MDLEAKIDGLFPTYVFNFDLSKKVDWKKLIPILDEEVDKRHVLEEEENAEKFKDPIPTDEQSDLIKAYNRRLFSGNIRQEMEFGQHWSDMPSEAI